MSTAQRQVQALFAVRGNINRVTLLIESSPDEFSNLFLVFDDQ